MILRNKKQSWESYLAQTYAVLFSKFALPKQKILVYTLTAMAVNALIAYKWVHSDL